MIKIYCHTCDMWSKNILTTNTSCVFTSEFIEWCEGKEVTFKSEMFGTGELIELPVKEVTRKLWGNTIGVMDVLCMDEETALLFKLTWL